jgi:hypothetical protein
VPVRRLLGLVGLFASLALASQASSSSIPTKIISGGEVSITEAEARFDGQDITVSGVGYPVFPHQTCGDVEVAFLNASGEVLLRKVVEYDTSAWRAENPRKSPHRSRSVSFSLHIPMSTTVASVLVRHQSTGGCEHSWSLQHALDWLVDKFSANKGG